MRRRQLIQAALLLALVPAAASARSLIEEIRAAGPIGRQVLAEARLYEPQILWTPLRPLSEGRWQPASTQTYGIEPRRWYAAASFVKLPLAALLLEALEQRGIDAWEALRLRVDTRTACAPLPEGIAEGLPLVDLLRAMLVVSDNLAYNALFELLGSSWIHARLQTLGFPHIRMGARLGCGGLERPGKLPAQLLRGDAVIWDSPAQPESIPMFPFGAASKGRAWMEGGRVIEGPRDFRASNFLPLSDVHQLTLELGGGELLQGPRRFALSAVARARLREWMLLLPRQCPSPHYVLPDDHGKWLLTPGDDGRFAQGLEIASKNAMSFGYLGDSAVILDRRRARGLALTASLFVDRDGVLNDGRYAYEEIGRPFLRALGDRLLRQA